MWGEGLIVGLCQSVRDPTGTSGRLGSLLPPTSVDTRVRVSGNSLQPVEQLTQRVEAGPVPAVLLVRMPAAVPVDPSTGTAEESPSRKNSRQESYIDRH